MDSMDLEREKGITILAKNTAVRGSRRRREDQHRRHARPRRLRRRGRAGADDGRRRAAARRRQRGPAPADAVRAAQGARAPASGRSLVVNKVDRPDARIDEVVDEVYELFLDLDADATTRSSSRSSTATPAPGRAALDRASPRAATSSRCSELLLEHVPAPEFEPDHPLQALVTNLDASPYLGRLALCRVQHGTIRKGQTVAWCRADGTIERVKLSELYVTEALDRVAAAGGRAGRDHRDRRHRRRHDRRDARRPRRSAPAARDHRRRAQPRR